MHCRALTNALLREIDSLRRGFDHVPAPRRVIEVEHVDIDLDIDRADPSRPRTIRPSYAVDPVGTVHPPPRDDPPPAAPPVFVANHYRVTNLGTLMDVLA